MSKSTKIPDNIKLSELIQNRMQEISSLSQTINADPRFGKLAGQQVPRHMRRRAVAHDVMRLPRRLRGKYLREKDKEGGESVTKRPSRKHRRRPANLLNEYNRRQQKQYWLETHIWHAKRFHMYYKWGYKIPGFPNDKGWRACYRATKSSCLMFDLSYFNTIQLQGPKHVITNELSLLTRPETGQVFNTAESYLEQTALVYLPKADDSSDALAAEVSYIWLPDEQNSGSTNARIWISSHPGFIKDLWKTLDVAFALNLSQKFENEEKYSTESSTENEPPKKKQKTDEVPPSVKASQEKSEKPLNDKTNKEKTVKEPEKEKLAPRNIPHDRTPKYKGKEGITVTDFQGVINRFRLVGPKRFEIMKTTCVPATVKPKEDANPAVGKAGLQWWKKYFGDREKERENEELNKVFGESKSVDSLTCLTVRDPRILLPIKKYVKPVENKDTKSSEKSKIAKSTYSVNKSESSALQRTKLSPLFFDSKIRDSVTLSKATNCVINKRRGNLGISGVTIPIDDVESRVPVLLSPQNHIDSLDILVPAGWAMPFWMCLVYNGCRVGGEKEFDHLQLEQSRPPLMYRYPDSPSGEIEAETRKEELQKDYFDHPPLHRCSYPILGIASPFTAPWKILIKDWAAEDAFINKTKPEITSIQVMRDTRVISSLQQLTSNSKVISSLVMSSADENCLVPVKLKIACRGRLGANSLICLPSRADLEEVMESGLWEGPVETNQQDDMEKQRKETIETHKAQKKRLKRKWKKLKDKQTLMKCQSTALGKELDTEKLNYLATGMATLKQMRNTENAAFAGKSEDLWIGEFNTVRNSCKREVMGYVTIGDMSYTEGCYVGRGFVTMKGARSWLQLLGSLDTDGCNSSAANQARNLVLTRETSSPQYRFSYLEFV